MAAERPGDAGDDSLEEGDITEREEDERGAGGTR